MSNEVLVQRILTAREELRQLKLQEEEIDARIKELEATIEEGVNILMGMDMVGKPVDVTRVMSR